MSGKITQERLEAIRQRAEKATVGPWNSYEVNGEISVDLNDSGDAVLSYYSRDEAVSNAEFIAHARQDIPDLLAEVERLQSELNYAKGLTAWYRDKAVKLAEKVDKLGVDRE